jgi:hypothetical protein
MSRNSAKGVIGDREEFRQEGGFEQCSIPNPHPSRRFVHRVTLIEFREDEGRPEWELISPECDQRHGMDALAEIRDWQKLGTGPGFPEIRPGRFWAVAS